jgi:hypothetical protein
LLLAIEGFAEIPGQFQGHQGFWWPLGQAPQAVGHAFGQGLPLLAMGQQGAG